MHAGWCEAHPQVLRNCVGFSNCTLSEYVGSTWTVDRCERRLARACVPNFDGCPGKPPSLFGIMALRY